jgi:16S rRNA (cytosine967-C5)-methyltransferase
MDARDGERVLDVCAAPGSKATHIATRTPGLSMIVAGDIHEHRARQILKAATRQGIERLRVVLHDAENALPYAESSFDRVLVDAPCTGTGTLRRNPEIRWRISARDILDLSRRQRGILASAARMVRPLGHLLYSTCSVEPEENEDVVARFLAANDAFKLDALNVQPEILGESGAARTWPHRSGADGFFIALFKRRS